ncbi:MAG: gamma-glutamyl-gamma-aminobutyrate hydrolase family protein [Acidimicrobiales bacterium]
MTSSGGRERPVIGITAYDEEASWGSWHTKASLVPADYVRSLVEAGANPVILPVHEQREATLDALVRRLDGLMLTGGPDVDPARYRAAPHPRSQPPRFSRDEREVALLSAAERSGLPVLAICRGMQLLNVAHGGTLIQHLPDVVGHEEHSPTPGTMSRHLVRIASDSLLHQVLGWDERYVPTHHHQAVERLAGDLSAVAWTDDGTIEAVESPSKPFLVGVQWHAEADDDMSVFEALVREASAVLAARQEDVHRPVPS